MGEDYREYFRRPESEQDSSDAADPIFDDTEGFEHPEISWQVCYVARRQIRTEHGVFWDMGVHNGVETVLRITAKSLKTMSKEMCYRDYSILWHCDESSLPRFIATEDSGYKGITDVNLLWDFIKCDRPYRQRVLGWLVNALICGNTQTVLELIGHSSSGKSSAGDFARDLIDPVDPDITSGRARKSLSGLNKVDKYRAIRRNAVVYEDNIAGLRSEMQNLLCTVCTGLKVDLRLMYSPVFESLWLKRPVILTSLHEVITQPDLVSRSARVRFTGTPGEGEEALSEDALRQNWKRDRPRILRALAELVSLVLARMPDSKGRADVYQELLKVIHGEQTGAKMIRAEEYSAAVETVQSSPFCITWAAFIQSTFTEQGITEAAKPTRTWLDEFEAWHMDHVGQHITVETTDGTVMETLTPSDDSRSKTERTIPVNPRALGAMLNKYSNELRNLVGINADDIVGKQKQRLVRYEPFI